MRSPGGMLELPPAALELPNTPALELLSSSGTHLFSHANQGPGCVWTREHHPHGVRP